MDFCFKKGWCTLNRAAQNFQANCLTNYWKRNLRQYENKTTVYPDARCTSFPQIASARIASTPEIASFRLFADFFPNLGVVVGIMAVQNGWNAIAVILWEIMGSIPVRNKLNCSPAIGNDMAYSSIDLHYLNIVIMNTVELCLAYVDFRTMKIHCLNYAHPGVRNIFGASRTLEYFISKKYDNILYLFFVTKIKWKFSKQYISSISYITLHIHCNCRAMPIRPIRENGCSSGPSSKR